MDLQEHLKFLVGVLFAVYAWSVLLNLVGNVVAFIPFGVFLPVLFQKCRNFFLTVLFSMEFSLCVEVIQLVGKVGILDVDDVILNTLGGLFGYVLYWLFV